jgi:hypothetical protein
MFKRQEALDLVAAAFEQAKQGKKKDWRRMHASTLNARLLQITDRNFDPPEFGAKNLRDLLDKLMPAVRITPGKAGDYIIEWIGDAPPSLVPPDVIIKTLPIRQDLRGAVTDYRSGKVYVWDPYTGQAREGGRTEELPILPTLTSAEAAEWRGRFLEAHQSNLARADLARALRWKEQALLPFHLPAPLQPKWEAFVSQEVQKRLQIFFGEQEKQAGLSVAASEEKSDATISPVSAVDEEGIRSARNKGQPFVAGELLARGFVISDGLMLEGLLARVIASWAAPLEPVPEPATLLELKDRLGEFSSGNIALAVVSAARRLKLAHRDIPESLGDIMFRVKDDISRIFQIDARKRPSEACQLAVATLEASLSRIAGAIDVFVRSTPSTAKAASLALLKSAHQLQSLIVPAERNFVRELEMVVGAAFRKFCESYERHNDQDVVRRAPELRENLQRFRANTDDPRTFSAIWLAFVAPVLEHVSALVDEAMSKGEASLSPVLALVNPTTKANLQVLDQNLNLTLRLANTGRGQALDVSMTAPNHPAAKFTMVDPRGPFTIGPENDQLVSIALNLAQAVDKLEMPISWTCRTATGSVRTFEDRIVVQQQSTEPEWDRLLMDPPYSLNPIKRRDRLYGRDSTLQQLRLAALAGASTFLWGQKRIGKTSLLQVLAAELAGLRDTSCLILRMGEVTSLHEGQIAHRIAQRLVEASGLSLQVPRDEDFGAGMSRLVPFVEKLVSLKPAHKYVVVIDEFDDLDPAFYTGERGRQFIKALRSLSEIGLTFFFVGSERMDLIYRRHQSDLNKWRNYALDRIDKRDECAALITVPVAGAIEYASQAIDFIIDYCSGNPFYIHNFCYQVFERCMQEHRTFVSEHDVQIVRQQLLRTLGQTNFAHFWEDNPELDPAEKAKQAAENCIALACIAVLGGRYAALEDLGAAVESLPLSLEDRPTVGTLRFACDRLKQRRILVALPKEEGFAISLPLFREWLAENADPRLLSVWTTYAAQSRAAKAIEAPVLSAPIIDMATFPIPEDDLIAVTQRLVYCGHQKDAAEIRQWLRQFDDDNRIEVAFLLLKRLAERGFINEGSRGRALHKLAEMIHSRRTEIGARTWRVVRGRLDNLCVTYVDSEIKSGAVTAREVQKIMRPGKVGSPAEISSWMRSHLEDDCIVVVVDDFAGTGRTLAAGIAAFKAHIDKQVWQRYVKEGRIAAYIMFAFPDAIRHISASCPGIEAIGANLLADDVRALDPEAEIFADESERRFAEDVLTQIGRELTPQAPLGFGDLGALVVFHNAAPNNTLPIFWSNGKVNERPWKPLFPRA